QRAQNIINLIKNNVSFQFRKIYVAKVTDSEEIGNAWSLGTHILITRKAMQDLDDEALTAVLAHEMAHREKWHLFSRAGMYVGGAVVAFMDSLFVDRGEDFNQRYSGFNEYYSTRQEMQADCLAYNWLKELRKLGVPVSPMDLNRARNELSGINFDTANPKYFHDNPEYQRHMKVKSGYSHQCQLKNL
ncbi:MAG: M48 family metalloprotease, partial [Bdellovibrionales bacterium]|nr:M48 family metalloprotease [Bdellovibrionales bacterium]